MCAWVTTDFSPYRNTEKPAPSQFNVFADFNPVRSREPARVQIVDPYALDADESPEVSSKRANERIFLAEAMGFIPLDEKQVTDPDAPICILCNERKLTTYGECGHPIGCLWCTRQYIRQSPVKIDEAKGVPCTICRHVGKFIVK